jgi:hypothetical protein
VDTADDTYGNTSSIGHDVPERDFIIFGRHSTALAAYRPASSHIPCARPRGVVARGRVRLSHAWLCWHAISVITGAMSKTCVWVVVVFLFFFVFFLCFFVFFWGGDEQDVFLMIRRVCPL